MTRNPQRTTAPTEEVRVGFVYLRGGRKVADE